MKIEVIFKLFILSLLNSQKKKKIDGMKPNSKEYKLEDLMRMIVLFTFKKLLLKEKKSFQYSQLKKVKIIDKFIFNQYIIVFVL